MQTETLDLEVFGFRDAAVLALIRYRTELLAPADDGRRYWTASYEDMAAQLVGERPGGRDAVKRALLSLRAKGAVTAKRFGPPTDQKWAYSADLPGGEIALVRDGSDQPQGGNAPVIHNQGENALVPGRKRPGTRAKTPSLLPIETGDKEEKRASAPTSPPTLTVISNSNPSLPPMQRQPRCDRHPNGTSAPCRQCQQVREYQDAAEAEDAQARDRLNRHVLAAIDACGECDDRGFADDGDAMRRCTLHINRDGMVS